MVRVETLAARFSIAANPQQSLLKVRQFEQSRGGWQQVGTVAASVSTRTITPFVLRSCRSVIRVRNGI
ncbi:hypothetical protein Y032_0196g1544 [Ancylostoma ceylanicum]|uniref:Uncharacterized protein n=1 Tax=Ancylostoma ceylanicum TaxID=53326 RepID=A0A016SPI2_9BILA|nr:hypothetical protein Y032_0196g1544 [Ancylostoma ceylanicum]